MEKRKPPTLFWPEITDRIDAEALVKRAVGICIFISVLNVALLEYLKKNPTDTPDQENLPKAS